MSEDFKCGHCFRPVVVVEMWHPGLIGGGHKFIQCKTCSDEIVRLKREKEQVRAEVERLTKTLHEVRVSRSQLDCRYTPGPYADSGGNHCPIDKPCERCIHDAEVARLKGRVVELERLNGWLSKIADARKAEIERRNGNSCLEPWAEAKALGAQYDAEIERQKGEAN